MIMLVVRGDHNLPRRLSNEETTQEEHRAKLQGIVPIKHHRRGRSCNCAKLPGHEQVGCCRRERRGGMGASTSEKPPTRTNMARQSWMEWYERLLRWHHDPEGGNGYTCNVPEREIYEDFGLGKWLQAQRAAKRATTNRPPDPEGCGYTTIYLQEDHGTLTPHQFRLL